MRLLLSMCNIQQPSLQAGSLPGFSPHTTMALGKQAPVERGKQFFLDVPRTKTNDRNPSQDASRRALQELYSCEEILPLACINLLPTNL